MNNNYDDKIIKDTLEQIHTPEYDVSKDVIKKISAVPKSKYVLRKILIAAFIICLFAVTLGAARLIGWQSFNLFGERVENDNSPANTPMLNQQNDDPFTEKDNLFISNVKLGESRLVVLEDGSVSGSCTGFYKSDDFDTIETYVIKAQSPLSLPSYIPDGYTFLEGKVMFYLDSGCLEAEIISSETKDGKIYEVYKLPKGYDKNIESLRLEFIGSDGNKLTYETRLAYAIDEETSFSHGAPESAVSSKIDILGFNEAILIHDAKKANLNLNTAVLYKEIPEITYVFSLASALHPSKNMPQFNEEAYTHKFSAIIVTIDSEILSEEEVIKIAESIN